MSEAFEKSAIYIIGGRAVWASRLHGFWSGTAAPLSSWHETKPKLARRQKELAVC
jgi:hypothetical protein